MSVIAVRPDGRRSGSVLGRLALTELRLYARERVRLVVGVGIPLLLLIIFGSIPFYRQRQDGAFAGSSLLDVYVPILIAFSLAMLSLTALPMMLTGYRERGVLRRLRTTPAGPVRLLAAQLLVNAGIAAVALVLVLAVARIAYGVALPRQPAGFALAALLSAAALLALGLLIAAVAHSARSAQAIGALVFYPLMFFAGLFFPMPAMSPVLREISRATPLGAAVQALQDASAGHWPHVSVLLTLAGYAVAFALAGLRLFRWE
jgi:ABC-2 type transport system permease protein